MATGNNLEPAHPRTPLTQGAELEPTAETLPRTNRIIIFGSTLSGGWDLYDVIDAYLKDHGLSEDDLLWSRHVQAIENSFYKGPYTQEDRMADMIFYSERTQREETQRSLLGKIGSTFLSGSLEPISPTYLADTPRRPERPDTLPLAVFALPEMRGDEGLGKYSTGTPYDRIQALCDKHGVPLFRVERYTAGARAELEKGLAAIEPQSSQAESAK